MLLLTLLTAAMGAPSPKRGLVADGCKNSAAGGAQNNPAQNSLSAQPCQDVALLTGASWYYAYNPSDPYAPNGSPSFVPMHWCLPLNVSIPATVNTTYLLGPNEPNNAHNCNTPPATIAKAWSTVLANWAPPATTLVSPATAGDGRAWLDAFFANCTALYGPKGCQIGAVAVHDYSCTASETMAYLQAIHERYLLKIWLTEFSCGDGAQNKPQADHLAYMKEIIPLLEAAPYVERYAWMSAHSSNRGLVQGTVGGQQTLTAVGELYNAL